MKASRIISLLFSLAQVIFILKLIEYARAAEVDIPNSYPVTEATFQPLTAVPGVRESHALDFKAGPRRKKIRTRFPVRASDVLPSNKKPAQADSKMDLSAGRGCPACASGECNTNAQEFAIPVLQLKVAAAVIAIWLAIWFKVWKFPLVKPSRPATSGYPAASGGYGGYSGGYISPSTSAPPVDVGYGGGYNSGGYGSGGYGNGGYNSNGDASDSSGSILDNVLKAFEKYSQS
ncbi:unnamed protein product [Allacma fusca]|uniref:Uncharacterized protein n=1 Tax=Allacma fusca TaxID=39272 RepID=A0A8J2JYN9_9HEXA|nr:unnamed protein product [Allacma fusca]